MVQQRRCITMGGIPMLRHSFHHWSTEFTVPVNCFFKWPLSWDHVYCAKAGVEKQKKKKKNELSKQGIRGKYMGAAIFMHLRHQNNISDTSACSTGRTHDLETEQIVEIWTAEQHAFTVYTVLYIFHSLHKADRKVLAVTGKSRVRVVSGLEHNVH